MVMMSPDVGVTASSFFSSATLDMVGAGGILEKSTRLRADVLSNEINYFVDSSGPSRGR